MQPKETLQLRALQWLYEQPANYQLGDSENLSSVFPNGPDLSYRKLDFMVADAEGVVHFVLQLYFTEFASVLELIEGLGDPDDVYKRKVKKGVR